MSTSTRPQLPAWVRPASRVIIALQRAGIALVSFHVLTVRGRRTGKPRETVVSPFAVDGRRYVLSFGELTWVRNVRAEPSALLRRGHKVQAVRLVEVPAPESAAIVAEFPRRVPAGVRFFVQLGLVDAPGRPEQFVAAAAGLTLFRIDPASA